MTSVRFGVQVAVGLLTGLVYLNIGNNAAQVFNNAGCMMFGQIFLTFTAMMSTVATCKISLKIII